MRLIEIKALPNGAHNNQTVTGTMPVPKGWAVIPEDMETPNFPFGDIEVAEINGAMTVTLWTPGVMPEPEPTPEPELNSTLEERVTAVEEDVAALTAAVEKGLVL